jgi:hypothetical protein
MNRPRAIVFALSIPFAAARTLPAHDGPPFPIVSDRVEGAYTISVWTDPDTTDDGSNGGQFWVMIGRRDGAAPVPPATRATVTAVPLDRAGPTRTGATAPVRDDVTTQFASLVLDHEGRFGVRVSVDGPLGSATLESEVSATYDQRPPPIMIAVYLMPFLLVGLLWARLLLRRRKAAAS